jgi:MraZ protein
MFLGSSDHVLDDKGRTSLPRDFRQQLAQSGQKAYITAKPGCLAIYLEDEFFRLCQDYAELHIDSREKLERLHVGNAQVLNIDRQGRVLVPPALRRLARLERDIMFLGVGNRIEIWDRDRYTLEQESISQDYSFHAGNRKDRPR